MNCKLHRTMCWVFQLIAALILLQTLYFKFSGAPESKFIFATLGAEPWGRFAVGLLELAAAAMLLWERLAVYGALLTLGLMSGALLGHFTLLGLVVQNDGGLLFALAVTVFGAGVIVLWLRRYELPYIGTLLFTSHQAGCSRAPVKP